MIFHGHATRSMNTKLERLNHGRSNLAQLVDEIGTGPRRIESITCFIPKVG